jgi:hypothetical protein
MNVLVYVVLNMAIQLFGLRFAAVVNQSFLIFCCFWLSCVSRVVPCFLSLGLGGVRVGVVGYS